MSEQQPVRLDDPVLVRVEPGADLGDRARVDPDVEPGVDALGGVEHARAANDDVVLPAVLRVEHQATPISCRSAALTPVGPWVSRS